MVRHVWVGGDLTLEDLTGGVGGFLGPTGVVAWFLGPTGVADRFLGPTSHNGGSGNSRGTLSRSRPYSGGGGGRNTLSRSCLLQWWRQWWQWPQDTCWVLPSRGTLGLGSREISCTGPLSDCSHSGSAVQLTDRCQTLDSQLASPVAAA